MKVYPYGVGEVVTRVHEEGDGDNAIVLCHGVAARGDRWRYNIPVFAAAGYHAYAIDNPGHGFATKGPDFPYGVPGFAAFIADFVRSLGHGAVHLIGTSMGGHNVARIACRHPELVKSLVLVGATGLFELGEETRQAIGGRIGDTSRAGIDAKLKGLIHHDDRLVTEAWRDEEYRVNNSPGAADAFAALAEYFRTRLDEDAVGEELAERAGELPILLVWGTEDLSVPLSVGRKAQAILGGPPLVEMTECAHAPYLEDPETFNRAVLDFLDKLD